MSIPHAILTHIWINIVLYESTHRYHISSYGDKHQIITSPISKTNENRMSDVGGNE